jgi:hypothetical protein
MPEVRRTTYLRDLWDLDAADKLASNPLALFALSLELTRRGPENHELWRRKYQFEDGTARSFTGRPTRVLQSKAAEAI